MKNDCTGLSAGQIQMELMDSGFQGELYVMDTVPSTNDYAKTLAAQGAPSGTAVISDSQSAGRGRMGRQFLSPQGKGIYFSWIFRPDKTPEELMHLTCCTAVAMCRAIEKVTALQPEIKWTNDLVCGGKKLAGILTELSLGQNKVQYAVVGIGINCAQDTADFDPSIRDMATSLKMAAGITVNRNQLAAQMIRELEEMGKTMFSQRRLWMECYRRRCVTVGSTVSVEVSGVVRRGRAVDVDDWGALLVDFGSGAEPVQSGEVSVRGMYGYV